VHCVEQPVGLELGIELTRQRCRPTGAAGRALIRHASRQGARACAETELNTAPGTRLEREYLERDDRGMA